MAKRYPLVFGVVGYLVVIWYYFSFALVPSGLVGDLLQVTCFSCFHITALKLWRIFVFELAPPNTLVYAAIGFAAGKVIQKLRRVST